MGDWMVWGDRMEPYSHELTETEARSLITDLSETHDGTQFYAENVRTGELIEE